MSSSAFVPTVLTIPGSTSTSSGEKNYVLAADGNATGLWVASGVTISTSTSTIPDNITRTTSLAISWVSGTTGYARYRFTLDQADYAKKFKIQWDQIYGTAGHWTLQVFSNTAADYSGTSTALTVQTSGIPGVTGTFTTSVDMPIASAPYIEIRIVAANTSATTLYLNAILVGPGTITQGAVVSSDTILTTITTQGFNHSSPNISYRRVGSRIEVQGYWTNGTVDTNQARFTLPLSLTIDGSSIPSGSTQVVGYWQHASVSANFPKRGTILATGGQNYVRFSLDDYTNSTSSLTAQNANAFTQNAISFEINFSLPIAEWSSSGTVNLGPGAQQEFASNNGSGGTAANTSYNTGSVAGPSGSAIVAVASTSSSYFQTRYKVNFQYPIQSDDVLVLEIAESTTSYWRPVENSVYAAKINGTGYRMGMELLANDTTSVYVGFGNAGAYSTSATYDAAGAPWSGESNIRWRVRKAKASSPVGFGLVDANSSGLQKATSTLGLMRYNTQNGYGSTNVGIRRFSTLVASNSDVTYADTAAAATSFTINVSGVYSISYSDAFSAAATVGLSVNSAQLSTSIALITAANRLVAISTGAAHYLGQVTYTGYFTAGDVIRPHADGTTSSGVTAAVLSTFTIQRIA